MISLSIHLANESVNLLFVEKALDEITRRSSMEINNL